MPEMWSLAKSLLQGSITVTLRETAAAVKLLIERNRIVAEGAGATSVAAALTGGTKSHKIVCVVSGGNIDSSVLIRIIQDETP
ncbi:pyridoxal-phosphate dependent enzyme [Candidatus Bathyarchaeota archaeon]|nr:MAG: pyridoxal-phosphate dependent enzyme [Candidatus Bathyarchaeota archaeon]